MPHQHLCTVCEKEWTCDNPHPIWENEDTWCGYYKFATCDECLLNEGKYIKT